jgi:hypothetical protein
MNKKNLTDPEYKSNILTLRDSGAEGSIDNKGSVHAAIAAGTIFSGAKEYINIYTGKLNNEVSQLEDFMLGLKSAILRNIKISVVMDEYDSENISKALEMLIEYSHTNDNIKVNIARPELIQMLNEESLLTGHFMYADDTMIRQELDAELYTAKVSFNTNIGIQKDIFNLLISHSTKI